MNEGLRFDHPWALAALLLALLPLVQRWLDAPRTEPWLGTVPADVGSRAVDGLLRALAALAIAATVLALAGPHRPPASEVQVGQGAEIVVVFDRSSSMDDRFTRQGQTWTAADRERESKAAVARRLLLRFARERDHDAFALVHFAEFPIAFLPFTQKTALVDAAMRAAAIGRGLGNTDIGQGLLAGAAQFDERPYVGSRVVLLVSDGGARLDTDMRERLTSTLRRNRVGVYWLYLRGAYGRKLVRDGSLAPADAAAVPEQALHDFLAETGVPFKAYEAERPEDVERAIADFARLEQRPILTTEMLPRRDLVPASLAVALAAVGLLLAARALQVRGGAR